MAIYWFLFAIPVVAAIFPRKLKRSQQPIVWAVFGVILAVFIGLRHEVGGDWNAYERSFWYHGSLPFSALFANLRDPGYYWTGWLLYKAGSSIYFLNLFCATILSWGVVRFCRTLPAPWLGVVAAVPYLIIVVGMGYTRQAAAIGLILVGLSHLNRGAVKHYLVLVLLAALMHRTALVLLPLAIVATSKNRLLMFVAVLAFGFLGANFLLANDAERMWESYVESAVSHAADGAPVRVAMNAVAGMFFLVLRKHLALNDIALRSWSILSWVALACVPLLAVSLTAVDRIALYLIPVQIYVSGSIVLLPVTKFTRTFAVLGVVAIYAAVLFVWLNFAHHSSAWLPYNSLLWVF